MSVDGPLTVTPIEPLFIPGQFLMRRRVSRQQSFSWPICSGKHLPSIAVWPFDGVNFLKKQRGGLAGTGATSVFANPHAAEVGFQRAVNRRRQGRYERWMFARPPHANPASFTTTLHSGKTRFVAHS
jgi:hypothetical protein